MKVHRAYELQEPSVLAFVGSRGSKAIQPGQPCRRGRKIIRALFDAAVTHPFGHATGTLAANGLTPAQGSSRGTARALAPPLGVRENLGDGRGEAAIGNCHVPVHGHRGLDTDGCCPRRRGVGRSLADPP